MSENPNKPIYLFSIDLEDIRDMVPNGHQFAERLPETTQQYLDFLRKDQAQVTFFVVGDVARNYPEVIQQIMNEGHEIACHSDKHIPLDQLGEEAFQKDLDENINALLKAGANDIKGFRAPIFSLTQTTQWAYKHLAAAGITYSSSVLPANNFQYGWEDFGKKPKTIENVVELPMSILGNKRFPYPFGGGAYFRVLPALLINQAFKKAAQQHETVLGYFHPYDIDTKQKGIRFPYVKGWFYNYLMYYNRKSVFKRLERVKRNDFQMMSYAQYIDQFLALKS